MNYNFNFAINMRNIRIIIGLLIVLALSNCTKEKELNAQEIVDKAIEKSGVDTLKNGTISFDFRDKHYIAKRQKGKFELIRTFDSITDIYSNIDFKRFIKGSEINLTDSLSNAYRNSVNSVHYFATLPLGLNDKAVVKTLLPLATINNKEYYKVKISFTQNGGGDDFEDVFVYWFDKETFLIEYLAYQFHTNNGGFRFREVIKKHTLNGVTLADYNNYEPTTKNVKVEDLDQLFEVKSLKLLSKIELQNINIQLNN